ncbi:hypothetical protein [Kocuria rosea]|uniref:hypothetical protein n=1 Tax=Kocuria rosea TaxID=1275 RepID=UPI00232B2615|nr:hypothetical protein [Kocuria rosea]
MKEHTPRHRAPRSAQARWSEWQGVLALIALPFLLAFLIWFAVRTDNVVFAVGMTVSAVIGTWWHDKRKSRTKERVGETGDP